jgi:hypothetical protein
VLARVPQLIGLLLLAAAVGVGLALVADGIRDRGQEDVISVTGSSKRQITSDFVVWQASVTSQRPTTEGASRELAAWTDRVRAFLADAGAREDELRVGAVSTETVTGETLEGEEGAVLGYRLTRTFTIRSARVDAITELIDRSAGLLGEGVPIAAQEPQYVFTKLPEIRPQLLADATRDAQQRAEVLVEATGGELGSLRNVAVGVFQITAPNSTEVSDYGVYDTTTIRKDVTAVVNVSFALR